MHSDVVCWKNTPYGISHFLCTEHRIWQTKNKVKNVTQQEEEEFSLGCTSFFIYFFFSFSWGWVRLSPLGTSVTIWPIVPAPDDR
jgi:hypothetical protein